MKPTLNRIAATAAVLLVVLAMGTQASADDDRPGSDENPEAGSNVAAEIMTLQGPLVAAADRITELDRDGYLGGVYLEVPEQILRVRWKGKVPPEVLEELDRIESEGIRVDLAEAPYSQQELIEVTRGLQERWGEYEGMTRAGPRWDGTGLEVGVLRSGMLEPAQFPVPVEFVVDQGVQQTTRFADTPPFWGGALARGIGGGAGTCTTGFAVARYEFWIQTSQGVLTAEHCAPGGGVNFVTGTGLLIGHAEPAPSRRGSDSLFIRTSSAARIYDGGSGIGEFSKPVAGSMVAYPGTYVCTSGAPTGVHCDIRTDSINNMVSLFPSLTLVTSVSLGTQVQGLAATAFGDSGGPVFGLVPNDYSRTLASGLMVGGLNPVRCDLPQHTGCFNRTAWADLGWVLIAQGASLLTS